MTRDDIILVARNAGLPLAWISEYAVQLAALVAAAEREKCARIADTYGGAPEPMMVGTYEAGAYHTAEAIAWEIRERSKACSSS